MYVPDDEEIREDEAMARADAYFNIGHHNAAENERENKKNRSKSGKTRDRCWLWVDGKLMVGNDHTHNMSFGVATSDRARFKGWYDSRKKLISFHDQAMEVKDVDEIPTRVYDHLTRRFKTNQFRLF